MIIYDISPFMLYPWHSMIPLHIRRNLMAIINRINNLNGILMTHQCISNIMFMP